MIQAIIFVIISFIRSGGVKPCCHDPRIRSRAHAPAGRAIVPPIPQNNQQQPVRRVRDYLAEDLEGLNPAVTIPEFEAEHFELKPVMFNMLNTPYQFGGSPAKNARQHLKSFLEICNSFKIHGVSNDVLKLKLFPYSLRDKAKAWLNNLPPGSLQSWIELCRSFLAKFSYTNMTDNLQNQITYFRQEDDEAMHEAWERYRDLFRRCPMHGLPEWTQVSIFYNYVNTPTRKMLDASVSDTLLDKPPRESSEILEKLAQNDYQHPTTWRGNTRRVTAQLDSFDIILAQISALTNMVKNMQRQSNTQEVKALDAFCELCGNNHDASECGKALESSYYIGNYNKNIMSNTYNPEKTSKFLLVESAQHPKSPTAKSVGISKPAKAECSTKSAKAGNQDATLVSLETQVGQISQILNTRPVGFPSDTEVAKGATPKQCKVIATRSGRVLEPTNKQSGTTTTQTKTSVVTDTPATADIAAEADEDHIDPTDTKEARPTTEASQPEPIIPDKLEEIKPPPPFPQRLKKQKQDYQFKKFFDILKQTAAVTETCLALMPNKVPAKKTDPGSFTIECSIEHNYSTKALCDHGASINLMPKSVFQKLGKGEAKLTIVMLQLADHSFVQPEGKIEDILIRIDKFIFPAEFLILDYESDENAPIILGRSFLATSRAVIDLD
ncbi:hypothetical protein GQ457_04G021350 [Hibiscus cannabinus]